MCFPPLQDTRFSDFVPQISQPSNDKPPARGRRSWYSRSIRIRLAFVTGSGGSRGARGGWAWRRHVGAAGDNRFRGHCEFPCHVSAPWIVHPLVTRWEKFVQIKCRAPEGVRAKKYLFSQAFPGFQSTREHLNGGLGRP